MTYEERQRYAETRERVAELRERIAAGHPEEPLTRAEALELLDLLEGLAERVSPERWDRALEAIANEAARRADMLAARRN
jgi:hypothetical protein